VLRSTPGVPATATYARMLSSAVTKRLPAPEFPQQHPTACCFSHAPTVTGMLARRCSWGGALKEPLPSLKVAQWLKEWLPGDMGPAGQQRQQRRQQQHQRMGLFRGCIMGLDWITYRWAGSIWLARCPVGNWKILANKMRVSTVAATHACGFACMACTSCQPVCAS
jgi:hypothetical protein